MSNEDRAELETLLGILSHCRTRVRHTCPSIKLVHYQEFERGAADLQREIGALILQAKRQEEE